MSNIKEINFLDPIEPAIDFNSIQIDHRNYIFKAVKEKKLNFKYSVCFCGEEKGEIIMNYDCWGFNIPTLICKNCNTIRSEITLDNESILKFYKDNYYAPHMFTTKNENKVGMDYNDYYQEELKKGKEIYKFVAEKISIMDIGSVLEIGCGLGGNLSAFDSNKIKIYGVDWGDDLISFAKNRLINGKFKVGGAEQFQNEKIDLIILSDVVEHLTDPNLFFKNLKSFIPSVKYVYINVPSFFGIGIRRWRSNIREYLKIEHTYCHTLNSLNLLLNNNGFSLIYGNEHVKAIYRNIHQSSNIKKTLMKNSLLKIKLFIFITNLKKKLFFDNKVGILFVFILKKIKRFLVKN